MEKPNKVFKTSFIRLAIGCSFFLILTALGCATWDDRDPRPPKLSLPEFENGDLQKIVALTLFDNRTGIPYTDVEQSFFRPFSDLVKEDCDEIVLYTPYRPDLPQALIEAALGSEKGIPDNMAIARAARLHGISEVITGRLESISGFEKVKGFWMFKGSQHYARIMIQVDLFAAETGAKLFSETFSQEVEISESEYAAIAGGVMENLPAVMEVYQELAEDIADSVCDSLAETPWIGFITGVEGDTATLSSGTDVGLQPGIRLELYNSNRIIQNAKGERFFVPGLKAGDIEITSTGANRARATLLAGAKAEPGYAVRLR